MARTRFANILVARLNELRNTTIESIGEGACSDYPHYRDMCGYLRGLSDTVKVLEELEGDNE